MFLCRTHLAACQTAFRNKDRIFKVNMARVPVQFRISDQFRGLEWNFVPYINSIDVGYCTNYLIFLIYDVKTYALPHFTKAGVRTLAYGVHTDAALQVVLDQQPVD